MNSYKSTPSYKQEFLSSLNRTPKPQTAPQTIRPSTSYKPTPAYKQEFLNTLTRTPKPQTATQTIQPKKPKNHLGILTKTTATNDVWNRTSYGTPQWKGHLYNTFYRMNHNEKEQARTKYVNPEANDKVFNMRRTQISEFSNALYNSQVFLNPRFSSC